MTAATVWVVVGIALLTAEIFIPGFAVAAFGLACIAAGIAAYLDWGLNVQLATFAVVTVVVFVTIRPLVLRYLDAGARLQTNVRGLVGKIGIVSQRLDPAAHTGRVTVEGDDWRAVPIDNLPLDTGRKVEVVSVQGTSLYVRPL
ncbi:MAG: NfeD family protein [FCB group bacterium]|jgi:membrane protein implicated in regulation of membrane protease activity|nr:NfeD family protein [FCB group bacterium]